MLQNVKQKGTKVDRSDDGKNQQVQVHLLGSSRMATACSRGTIGQIFIKFFFSITSGSLGIWCVIRVVYSYCPSKIVLDVLAGPVFVESSFKGFDGWSGDNFFRQTVPDVDYSVCEILLSYFK